MLSRLIKVALALTVVAIAIAAPMRASACGGFFCRSVPIDQTAERIIFSVDPQNRIVTSVVGINYTGAAPDFSWVVPVPSPPKLDVAETKSLDLLADATNLVFNVPPDPCPRPMMSAGNANAGGDNGQGGQFLQTGSVGPFDYAIIRNEEPGQMVAWLRTNGYRITPEMEPIINQYVKEGSYFLAMKLQRGKDVSEIKPVVMTYTGVDPAIPIRLTAVAAVPNLQVLVWVLGGAQFVPQNYAHPQVDFSKMRAGFVQVTESGSTYTTLTTYTDQLNEFQARYKGLAFVTEYAQPVAKLMENPTLTAPNGLDPIVSGLLKNAPYISRLRGQISPEQMTLDPIFTTDPKAEPFSNLIEVGNYVDAATFWSCPTK